MAASKSRGPKYPSIGLEEAISTLHPVFEAESRNKMSREVLAMHLGYAGLNGASTSKIGALRHFALIEGRGDELTVSEIAVTLMMKGENDPDYRSALKNAFLSPSLYKQLFDTYTTTPSQKNVEFTLVRLGVQKKNAQSAANDFIESGRFSGAWGDEQCTPMPDESALDEPVATNGVDEMEVTAPTETPTVKTQAHGDAQIVETGFEEKSGGLLSKTTEFKLYIKGPLGPSELKRLIRKVEIDIEILMDD